MKTLDLNNLPPPPPTQILLGAGLEAVFPAAPKIKGGNAPAPASSPASDASPAPAVDPAAPFGRKKDGTAKKGPGGRPGKASAAPASTPLPSPVSPSLDAPPPASPTPEPKGANDPLPGSPAVEVEVVPGPASQSAPVAGGDKAEANARRLARAFTVIAYGVGVVVFGPDFNEADEKARRASLEEAARTYFLERPDLSMTPGLAFGLECLAWVTDKARLPVVREKVLKIYQWAKNKKAPERIQTAS